MLDGLDLILEWYLADVRSRPAAGPVLFADQSGDRLHRGSVRNRLAHLLDVEQVLAPERFSPHAMRRACATHNYERGIDLVSDQAVAAARSVVYDLYNLAHGDNRELMESIAGLYNRLVIWDAALFHSATTYEHFNADHTAPTRLVQLFFFDIESGPASW